MNWRALGPLENTAMLPRLVLVPKLPKYVALLPKRVRGQIRLEPAYYPLNLALEYSSTDQRLFHGTGVTSGICTARVQFTCDRDLEKGLKVCLALRWPAVMSDGVSLNLWMFGIVNSSESRKVEVAIIRHEFRTRRMIGLQAEGQVDYPIPTA